MIVDDSNLSHKTPRDTLLGQFPELDGIDAGESTEGALCATELRFRLAARQAAAGSGTTHEVSRPDRFWSDTENPVSRTFQFTAGGWESLEDG